MKIKRRRYHYRRLCLTTALVVATPLLFNAFVSSIPKVNAAVEQLAVLSAGIALPEGGIYLLENGASRPADPQPEDKEATDAAAKQPEEAPQTDVSEDPAYQAVPPAVNSGPISREYFGPGAGNAFLKLSNNAYLKNCTSLSADEILKHASQKPAFQIDLTGAPQVLIMHTHTTESYEMGTFDYYDASYNSRTRDQTKNVVAVGEKIAQQLKAAGIAYIHDTTEHDYPSYTGAYDRSEVTVKGILEQNPSIKIVLDVHRDAIQRDDGTRVAPVAEINGKNAAQIMVISGCDDGTMGYPNYFENLKFASALQSRMEGDYPGLTRPILFDYRKYNQHLTTGSILLEMGAHGNSLEEALYSGELLGKSLAALLKELQ